MNESDAGRKEGMERKGEIGTEMCCVYRTVPRHECAGNTD